LVYTGKVAYVYKGTMPENTKITLLNGTSMISDYAFRGCTGLTSVTIPNSVTNIEMYAFVNCNTLTSVTFQGTITANDFNSYAFGDSNPDYVYIGDLREKYLAGGIGTYTRESDSLTWTKIN